MCSNGEWSLQGLFRKPPTGKEFCRTKAFEAPEDNVCWQDKTDPSTHPFASGKKNLGVPTVTQWNEWCLWSARHRFDPNLAQWLRFLCCHSWGLGQIWSLAQELHMPQGGQKRKKKKKIKGSGYLNVLPWIEVLEFLWKIKQEASQKFSCSEIHFFYGFLGLALNLCRVPRCSLPLKTASQELHCTFLGSVGVGLGQRRRVLGIWLKRAMGLAYHFTAGEAHLSQAQPPKSSDLALIQWQLHGERKVCRPSTSASLPGKAPHQIFT